MASTRVLLLMCCWIRCLGSAKIQLGMFTLDVEGVPVLLGMKTLRRLKAIIDFDRCLVVFAAVNRNLAIGLRRSRAGHLLLNLTQDWLSQGVQLDQIGSELKLHPEILQAEIEENEGVSAFMVVDDQPAAACTDVLAHVEGNQAHVAQTAISSESAPEAAKPVGDSVLAMSPGKSLCFAQRKRSQTTSRMSTLKALLTLAALHGACLSGNIHDGNGIRASSSSTQVGAKDQIQRKEGRLLLWRGAKGPT